MRSILEYGSSAGGREKAAVSAAARSYFTALADRDYGKICAALSAGSRHQLQAFLKVRKFQGEDCAGVVRSLLVSPQITTGARRAAHGRISAVRVKGGTAFVLFKPVGGSASFFALKREGGDWKATSLMPRLPLNPTAP